jgi:putative nucleotidyltransferase with HDIG domain
MQGFAQIFQKISADLSARVVGYVVVVTVAAAAVAATLIGFGYTLGQPIAVGALAVIAAVAERGSIWLRGRLQVSISLLPALFAAVLFGPLAGMVVFAASVVGLALPAAGRIAYAASRALTGALAALAATPAASLVDNGVGGVVAAATVGAIVAEGADVAFASVTYSLRGLGSWRVAARDLAPVVVASVPFYSPVVALLALAYRDVSPWTLPLFFAPALAAQRWFVLYQEQRRLAEDLSAANAQLERANLSFASALVATLDARDRYTAGHSAAVAVYAQDIAERMGLSGDEQRLARLCGLVHDIGKIGLPAGLLEKPGALSLDERREMQRHAEIGETILANVRTYAEIATVVRHHHERVDGEGYPDGLVAQDIPLLGRVIAVADAYNAMTSDRPYRDAMPSRVARLRLAQAVETQFDTAVVAAFEALLAGADEDYRLARGQIFSMERRALAPVAAESSIPIAVGRR